MGHQDIDLNGCLWCWNTICWYLWIFLPWIYVHSHRRSYVYNLPVHVVIHGVGYWSVGIHGHSVCIWSGCRTIYGGKVFYFVRCLAPVVLNDVLQLHVMKYFKTSYPIFIIWVPLYLSRRLHQCGLGSESVLKTNFYSPVAKYNYRYCKVHDLIV